MIYIIMGKSATGKDTVYARLCKDSELGLKKMIPYTTRPIRNGETEGEEYHFTDNETFERLRKEGKVAEFRQYNTVHGIWTYYTVDDNDDVRSHKTKYAIIGTLDVYEKLRDYYGAEFVYPVYICVDDRERITRAVSRESKQENPSYEEVCRRYIADEHDFSKERLNNLGITKMYTNYDIDECVANIKNDML